MHTWVPALLAIAAALLIAVGTVLRQRASASSGAITTGWWAGALIAICGFALQATALGLGSILMVQPLVVLAVIFALPLESWVDHRRPSRMDWVWVAVLVTCVAVFLILARPEPTDRRSSPVLFAVTVTAVIVVLIALVVIAERCAGAHYRALCYGLAAGALFGVAALLIKSVAITLVNDPVGVMQKPDVYLLVLVVTLAVVAQQKGFGAGDLQTSFPAMNVMEPVVAMVLGIVLLGESIRVGIGLATVLICVMAIAMVAVVNLAKDAAVRGDRAERREPAGLNR
ncbi:MAG: DMT family transporter [Gordonia sp. (in: high G+C Gram-positive bacteria)]